MDLEKACTIPPVLQQTAPATWSALLSCGRLKQHKKGEHLFLDGMKVEYVYFLITGGADLYKVSHAQEKRVIFVCPGGTMLNEVILQNSRASINCSILSDAWVLRFPIKQFQNCMEQDMQLYKAVYDSMALKLRRTYRQLKNTTNTTRIDRQIAAKLWKLSRDYGVVVGDEIMIHLDLSITYLAAMVGAKRETVSRQVKELTAAGLIRMNKNRFYIPDMEKLRKFYMEV